MKKSFFLNAFFFMFLSLGLIYAEAAEYYDFDDDGQADVLWRDAGRGKAYLSLMGTSPQGKVLDIAPTYDVRGISDLNNDSKDDIIIKDSIADDIYVSLMDGLNVIAEGSPADLSEYNLDNDAINNFDWNQIYELILQDTYSNTVYLWQDEVQAAPQIPLSLSCEGASEMMLSSDPDFTGASWEPYAEQTSFTLSANDGTKTIYTKFKNSLGEELDGLPVDIIIDTAPPGVSLTSPDNGLITGQVAVTVTGTLNEPCFKVLVNEEEADLNDTNFSVDLDLAEGDNTIQAVAFDRCGNIGFPAPITITLDTIAPQNPGISIAEGETTAEKEVHLNLSAEGADYVMLSEDINFADASWQAMSSTKVFTLSTGNGEKTIYAIFKDEAGNESSAVSDTIFYSGDVTINITTPFDSGIADANSIVVEGNFTGEAETIYVNGFKAELNSGNFIVYELPLFTGENQIQAQAYREQFFVGETTITITVNEAKEVIALAADPLSGEPPLTVNYSLTTDLTENIASYQWDYQGDNIFDYGSSEYEPVAYEYPTEQRYYPRVMITAESGLKFSKQKMILVHPSVSVLSTIAVDQPQDLALDAERNLYVLEQGSHSILKYDKDGNFIRNFGGYGDLEGMFDTPSGIAVDAGGNIYIADTANNRIQKLDSGGYMDINFGEGGIVTGLTAPYDIAVDSAGNVYVTEYPANKVKKYDTNGNFVTEWGNGGTLTNPAGIIYKYDTLYLANSEVHRIDQYSTGGDLLASIGDLGTEQGNFESPLNLCYDQTYEKLVIADTMNQRIQLLNDDHTFYREINNIGLLSPVAVVADNDLAWQIIYIGDKGNNQVLKLEILNDTAANNPGIVFSSLQQALSNEDINGAVAEFSEDSKEKYQGIFQGLAGHLGEVAQDMNNIYLVEKDENTAMYLIIREEEADEYGYYVYFERNKNGNWKISNF